VWGAGDQVVGMGLLHLKASGMPVAHRLARPPHGVIKRGSPAPNAIGIIAGVAPDFAWPRLHLAKRPLW